MLKTNEFTTLVKGEETIRILPNQPIVEIPAGYIVTAHARIVDEKGETFAILKAGQTTTLIKEVPPVVERVAKRVVRKATAEV